MAAQTIIVRPEKLEVRGLVKRYPGRRSRPGTLAVDGIDLTVRAGELVCIVGASGCGKSTLLNIIGGLEEPTEGAATVDGHRVVGPGPDRGMVFQGYSLFPWQTVRENVEFGLKAAGVPKSRRPARVDALLTVMGLGVWADQLPRALSGGMRRRLLVAILLPSLAQACGRSFSKHGVSIVNVGHTGLYHYARILQREGAGPQSVQQRLGRPQREQPELG